MRSTQGQWKREDCSSPACTTLPAHLLAPTSSGFQLVQKGSWTLSLLGPSSLPVTAAHCWVNCTADCKSFLVLPKVCVSETECVCVHTVLHFQRLEKTPEEVTFELYKTLASVHRPTQTVWDLMEQSPGSLEEKCLSPNSLPFASLEPVFIFPTLTSVLEVD